MNLTRIESRPLRSRLGHYLFHVDCVGGAAEAPVADAVEALRQHCEVVRVLGPTPPRALPCRLAMGVQTPPDPGGFTPLERAQAAWT